MAQVITAMIIVMAMTLWLYRAEAIIYCWMEDHKPPKAAEQKPAPEIPPDMMLHVKSFGADWARQQAQDAMYELYGQLGDWQKVRTAMGFSSGTI